VFESARTLVDQMVMHQLAIAGPEQALASLDRGRASLAPAGTSPPKSALPLAGREGEVAIEYGLIGDTLLIWTVRSGTIQLYRTAVDTTVLFRVIATTLSRMEGNAPESEIRTGLGQLYDWLLRPVERSLGAADTPIVIVTDGQIAAVPFAALWDEKRRRYVVQDHPIRFAVSLREPDESGRFVADAGGALFVVDPAFDLSAHPLLDRLKEASSEVSAIAAGYPSPRLLQGEQANGRAVRDALSRAMIVHYSGHAVFDDGRPEQSFLLLASSPANPNLGTLEASEIAQLDLRKLSLVVLAACRSVRTGRGRAAGFSGLTGAFLAAGARGAIGSLWEVDDGRTRPLMVTFHTAYRASGNGPGALRDAQLSLLASGDANLRSPASWGAFRYTGR